MASSAFAQKVLKKHGWKEGAGLGKAEHGMAAPIKVTLKMDKAGMGHDPGKEFTDHWWLKAFNDAAKKVGAKQNKSSGPFQSAEDKKASEQSDRKKRFYAGFVQSSTLSDGIEIKNEDAPSSSDEEEDSSTDECLPTLDDLHKFCGGATGHRAAMAGMKMGGKLARVAAQDKEFEEKQKSIEDKQKKKKSKHKNYESVDIDESKEVTQPCDAEKDHMVEKRKKKKSKHKKPELIDQDALQEELCDIENDTKNEKKKKKKSKHKKLELIEQDNSVAENVEISKEKAKKSKKKRKLNEDNDVQLTEELQEPKPKKKKKKSKNKQNDP